MVEPWRDTRAGQERLNLTEDAGTRRPCAGAVSALCSPSGLARGITAIRLVVQQDDPEDTAASCENSCPNAHPDSYAGSHRGCALAGAGTAMLAGAAAIVSAHVARHARTAVCINNDRRSPGRQCLTSGRVRAGSWRTSCTPCEQQRTKMPTRAFSIIASVGLLSR